MDEDAPQRDLIASLQDQLRQAEEQVQLEKAGKRKLFHSLVKVANELRQTRSTRGDGRPSERNAPWWQAPHVLPGVRAVTTSRTRPSTSTTTPLSLSDLFFNLVIVTGFTRVGVAMQDGAVDATSLLYFAILYSVWCKESSYSTRFATDDAWGRVSTLLTCFAVLFASLSVVAPVTSDDGSRLLGLAATVAILHCILHLRIALTHRTASRGGAETTETESSILVQHVVRYAILNVILTAAEAVVWLVGMCVVAVDSPARWWCCIGGLLLGQRIPRAFLADDFHGACCQRGVLFILLLGFLMQSIIVVASEFFEYQTPTLENLSFVGAACLLFFCIKLLYVDDAADLTRTEDHALLLNRYAAFWFNAGHFSLLLSTTVMGSGLNLLTHDYLASSAALPGAAKALVTGGFAAVLLSICFIKSMHLKRIPTDRRNQALFIGAYLIQGLVVLAIVGVTVAMSLGWTAESGILSYLMQTDSQLLFSLSGAALFLVVLSWLDEGVEWALYKSAVDSRQYRIHPFGLWWCLHSEMVSTADLDQWEESSISSRRSSTPRLSILSPLLGSSLADLKDMRESSYQTIPSTEAPDV